MRECQDFDGKCTVLLAGLILIVLGIAYRCVFPQGVKGTNLPRNTFVIVSIKCVYRDKRGFAVAETTNNHYGCCFSLYLTLRDK